MTSPHVSCAVYFNFFFACFKVMKRARLDYWHLDISKAQKAYEQDKVLFTAIIHDDYEGIISLISKGAYVDEKFFHSCIKHNRIHLISLMIEKYEYIITVSKPLLYKLCMKYTSNRQLLWYILNTCSVHCMFDLFEPLLHASIHGDLDMIKLIIHRFSFAINILQSPFFWAAKSGHLHIVVYILNVCGSIDRIHISNTLLNVVHDCCNKMSRIYNCAPIIRLLAQQKECTLFHCVEKCYKKQNAFILALLIPYLPHGFFAQETSANLFVIINAFKLRCATRRIIRSFKINRRLVLAKTLFKSMNIMYSPSIVEVIAKHGRL